MNATKKFASQKVKELTRQLDQAAREATELGLIVEFEQRGRNVITTEVRELLAVRVFEQITY